MFGQLLDVHSLHRLQLCYLLKDLKQAELVVLGVILLQLGERVCGFLLELPLGEGRRVFRDVGHHPVDGQPVGPQGNAKWDFRQRSRDLKSKFNVSLLDQNLGEKKQYF